MSRDNEVGYISALECPHEYISANGVCAGCGITYAGWSHKGRNYYNKAPSHVITKVVDRNILSDLSKYNFPDEIKHAANAIFQKIGTPTRRGQERNKMLFFLVYSAHKEKGKIISPQALGKDMGLSNGDINRALTAYSEAQTGYRPPQIKISPIDALPELCESLNLDYLTEEAVEIAKDVLAKCPSLREEFPHKVAAGILRYYMDINGIQVSPEIFKEKVDFSDVTIKDIYERITIIHNQ